MRPVGQNKRSARRLGGSNGVNDVMTDGVAGTGNSSERVPEEGNSSGMPPLGEVGCFNSGRVSPTVAAEAAEDVNEFVMDSVPLLVPAGGGGGGGLLLLPNVAGAANLAIAEVAPSDDFAGMVFPAVAGVTSPVDLAGLVFPAVVGEMSLTEVAGMALPPVSGVVPPVIFWSEALPAVAEVDSLIVVEMASSADLQPTK